MGEWKYVQDQPHGHAKGKDGKGVKHGGEYDGHDASGDPLTDLRDVELCP